MSKDGPNKMTKLAKFIASFGYEGVDHLLGAKGMSSYGSKQGRQKTRRPSFKTKGLYKPASSTGFRGSPKTSVRPGSVPAPTIDQVRRLEKAYMLKLDVHRGIMYFKSDQTVFSHNSAKARRQEKMQCMLDCCA
jgi:hypothetical protein